MTNYIKHLDIILKRASNGQCHECPAFRYCSRHHHNKKCEDMFYDWAMSEEDNDDEAARPVSRHRKVMSK